MRLVSPCILRTAATCALLIQLPSAGAEEDPIDPRLTPGETRFPLKIPELSFQSQTIADRAPAQPEHEGPPGAADPRPTVSLARFGDENSQWITLGMGVAHGFGDDTDYNLRAAWSQFIIQDVEFSFEGNVWYSSQEGADALALNPALVFRWHFINADRWSIFGDLGIGLLFSTDAIPSGGTSFNFTPRAGVGFTYQITEDSQTRLQVGFRWHHISNARITGDANNPARDLPMIYGGVVFPF